MRQMKNLGRFLEDQPDVTDDYEIDWNYPLAADQ